MTINRKAHILSDQAKKEINRLGNNARVTIFKLAELFNSDDYSIRYFKRFYRFPTFTRSGRDRLYPLARAVEAWTNPVQLDKDELELKPRKKQSYSAFSGLDLQNIHYGHYNANSVNPYFNRGVESYAE